MVKFGENSAKFGQIWENLRNFGEKQQKIQRFLTKILRLESGAKVLFGVVLARPFFPHFSPMDSKAVQRSALCRSRRELSNEYLLAKIGVDTAENEPCKVCPLSAYRSPRCAVGLPQRGGCMNPLYGSSGGRMGLCSLPEFQRPDAVLG